MPSSCISYTDVSKSYNGQCIIDGLSLTIPADITTAIVGESGSGKTTLLQMANGIVIPERGQVSVLGSPIHKATIIKQRLSIGYSIQNAGLFPHLSVFENISLMARLQKWPEEKIRERFDHLVQLFELDADLSARYPFSLSGGQQQRVSLCRAMMLDPPLLLLDEPFSALDPLTRDLIHQEFLRITRTESRSVVLVTHDMNEALKIAEQIIVMCAGKIEQQGSAEDISSNPASEYVASLFRIGTERTE